MAAEDSPAVIHNPIIVKPILDLITIPSFAFSTTKLNHCRWHRFKTVPSANWTPSTAKQFKYITKFLLASGDDQFVLPLSLIVSDLVSSYLVALIV